jgi:hypothetical protein
MAKVFEKAILGSLFIPYKFQAIRILGNSETIRKGLNKLTFHNLKFCHQYLELNLFSNKGFHLLAPKLNLNLRLKMGFHNCLGITEIPWQFKKIFSMNAYNFIWCNPGAQGWNPLLGINLSFRYEWHLG